MLASIPTIMAVVGALALAAAGYYFGLRRAHRAAVQQLAERESEAARTLQKAREEAETIRRAAEEEGRWQYGEAERRLTTEIAAREEELDRRSRRLEEREANLDRKLDLIVAKEEEAGRVQGRLEAREKEVVRHQERLQALIEEATDRLERASGLSRAAAREEFLRQIRAEADLEAMKLTMDIKERAKRGAEREAKRILAAAIQRLAPEYVADATVSVVPLPFEEMKGRVIGREGRNIRSFEQLTGVDVIVDDTPEAVILSSFEPVRREVARLAMERLVEDGRIHPGRIEEMVERAKKDVEKEIVTAGEEATFRLGVQGLHPDLIYYLGRLKYRTSYGQNMLQHSMEVGRLAGLMAGELGEDVPLAKRAGLLHDIGKALTDEVEGSHAEVGYDLAKRYNEAPTVLNAMLAHHELAPPDNVISVLVQAADAASGARPGARGEALDAYVKRVEKLERVAKSFRGVEKCYAIHAGREVRVIVTPEDVDDEAASLLCYQVARKLEEESDYPGQVKVVVIRETRVHDFAR